MWGVKTTDFPGAAIRFVTSAITVPFQWLVFHKPLADGLEARTRAFHRKRQAP